MILALLIGILVGLGKQFIKDPLYEPLVIALVIAIILRTIIGKKSFLTVNISTISRLLIPIGIIFYALKNLNFIGIAKVESRALLLLMFVVGAYFLTIFVLSKIFKLPVKIAFLLANGSAICGASAIAITSSAIDAESDDISISLLSVTIAAFFGLFIVLPFTASLASLNNSVFAVYAGSVLQFTGFVHSAISAYVPLSSGVPLESAVSLGMLIKSARYLLLLLSIPLFASIIKKKPVLPLALWLFLGAGIIGTHINHLYPVWYAGKLIPNIIPLYNISWSVALAAIGLNADIRILLSNSGIKALIISFAGFFSAVLVFFAAELFLRLF